MNVKCLAFWQARCKLDKFYHADVMPSKRVPQHYWPFVRGIHRWSVDSPHQGPVLQNFLCCWTEQIAVGGVFCKFKLLSVFFKLRDYSIVPMSHYIGPSYNDTFRYLCLMGDPYRCNAVHSTYNRTSWKWSSFRRHFQACLLKSRIRSPVRKSLLSNMDFNIDFLSNPGPWRVDNVVLECVASWCWCFQFIEVISV